MPTKDVLVHYYFFLTEKPYESSILKKCHREKSTRISRNIFIIFSNVFYSTRLASAYIKTNDVRIKHEHVIRFYQTMKYIRAL